MKTTIDIPEPLYRQIKIRAVEQGLTLRELVVHALEDLVQEPTMTQTTLPYFARRKLSPGFKALLDSGTLRPKPIDRDITALISEERDDR